jgi:hypothetical protein
LLALFGLIEARSAGHLVPLRIFRWRALVGGNLGCSPPEWQSMGRC